MFSIIFIPIILLVLCLLCGITIQSFLKRENRNVFIDGLVLLFGSLFIIMTPFMLLNLKLSALIIVVSFFYGVVSLYAIIFLIVKRKKYINVIKSKVMDNHKWLLLGILILFIVFQIFYVIYNQHIDIDDSYYLAQANTYIQTNEMFKIDPASGIASFIGDSRYNFVGFEIIFAILSKLFHINVAFLAHSVWPVFGILSHYIVIYELMKKINKKYSIELCFLYSIVNFFSGWTLYSEGAFLLNRIWQGKAFFVCIFVPVLISEFIKMYKKNISTSQIIYLFLLLLAGISATTVAIYLYPIQYFTLWCGWIIGHHIKEDIHDIIKLCIPILCIIPWFLLKLKILFTNTYSVSQAQEGTACNINFYIQQLYQRFLNNNCAVLILYIISLFVIYKFSSKKMKSVFVYPPVVLLLTFANPLLINFVAPYITGIDVYWRIFWLFDIPFVIVMAIATVIALLKKEFIKKIVIILSVGIIAALGTSIFEASGWGPAGNKYKIDNRSLLVANKILEDDNNQKKLLLVPVDISYGIRQYCGDIQLLINRYAEGTFESNGKKQEYQRLLDQLYLPIYQSGIWNNEQLKQEIKHFKLNYIVLYSWSVDTNQVPDNLELVYDWGDISLYCCK